MADNNLNIQEVGRRIRERRNQLGMTQELLAEKSNLTPQFVSYAESGKREIKIGSLLKIALSLETSCDYLLSGSIISKDKLLLSEKLSKLTGTEVRIIENIIDECIALNHTNK